MMMIRRLSNAPNCAHFGRKQFGISHLADHFSVRVDLEGILNRGSSSQECTAPFCGERSCVHFESSRTHGVDDVGAGGGRGSSPDMYGDPVPQLHRDRAPSVPHPHPDTHRLSPETDESGKADPPPPPPFPRLVGPSSHSPPRAQKPLI